MLDEYELLFGPKVCCVFLMNQIFVCSLNDVQSLASHYRFTLHPTWSLMALCHPQPPQDTQPHLLIRCSVALAYRLLVDNVVWTVAGYYIEWNNEWIHVFRPDVECTNGVIHVIDTVLLQESDIVVSAATSQSSIATLLALAMSLLVARLL